MLFESPHGSINCEVAGPEEAPAVVFTPGITMTLDAFAEQAAALSQSYRVIRWDLPDHGGSFSVEGRRFSFELCAECLVALFDELRVDAATLVGVSLGSLLHQYMAHHHPERVVALVDVGGLPLHAQMGPLTTFGWRLLAAAGALIPEKSYYRLFAKERAVNAETRQYLEEGIAAFGKKKVSRLTNDFLTDQAEGIPEPVDRPLLIINGEEEMSFVSKRSEKWHAERPGSQRVEIPDAGHIANMDNPEHFNETLKTFLDSLSASPQSVSHPER